MLWLVGWLVGCRDEENCRDVGPGLEEECPPWRSSYGILSHIYVNLMLWKAGKRAFLKLKNIQLHMNQI